jgi:polysaccharide export outer membrane protein
MTMAARAPCIAVLVAAAALSPAVASQAEYLIGARDVLSVSVWEQPGLSGKFSVDGDGTFTFPLIGPVTAAGRTLRTIEAEIRRRLADGFLKDPQVTVAIDQYHSQMVHVVGEVRQPGSYPLTGPMRLVEILARAGSTTERAGAAVVITRNAETLRVDLTGAQTGDAGQNLELREGDTIFVPRADMFFVLGEVRTPGTFPIVQPTTILQALAVAGGLTERGSDRRVSVIRLVDGRKSQRKVKLDEPVQAGDTIVVGQRYF